jgi:hypothetical protein
MLYVLPNFISRCSWILAIISVLILSLELFFNLPVPSKSFFHHNLNPISPSPSPPSTCCLATLINSTSFKHSLALGHSLRQLNSNITFYAILETSFNSSNISILRQYFNVINISESLIFPEAAFWELKDCFPVVAVSSLGIFRRPIDQLCSSSPFSAVSRVDEVVWFDPSLMVLDPRSVPAFSQSKGSFSEFSKTGINWHPLRPDLSVNDIAHEYMEFSLRYLSPTYIHFTADTFLRASSNQTVGSGSALLFEMIRPIINSINYDQL